MITRGPRARPPADLPAVVWEQYAKADKSPIQVLKASAAWIAAPQPVQNIKGSS